MRQDRIALHGFGKMFKKFWQNQIENIEKLKNFIVLRGGRTETPSLNVESLLSKIDYFTNQSSIIAHFFFVEKRKNYQLIELHQSTVYNDTEFYCNKKKYLNSLPFERDHVVSFLCVGDCRMAVSWPPGKLYFSKVLNTKIYAIYNYKKYSHTAIYVANWFFIQNYLRQKIFWMKIL